MDIVPWTTHLWPDVVAAWADHRRHAGDHALSAEAHDRALARLRDAVEASTPAASVASLLAELAIPWPPRHHEEVPRPEPDPLSTRELARIVLDFAPAAGDDGPRVLLGPWATALDVRRPRHVRAWAAAVAASAFAMHDEVRPPARSWSRQGVRPPWRDRQRLHAIGRAPPAPWRLDAPTQGGWRLTPLLPLAPAWRPDGPVDLSEVGGVDGPPHPGGLLLGRVVPGPGGGRAVAALVLPQAPPELLVAGWFARAALPLLAGDRSLSHEEILRRGGQRIALEAHAWWWAIRAGSRDDGWAVSP